jgi:hypothetical protein
MMTKTDYETHYRDTLKTAERVASYLRIARIATVLAAHNRRDDKTVVVFNHYGKRLPGTLTLHEADSMLQDCGKHLSDNELQAGLWSSEGIEIADGYRMRDVNYGADATRTFYEPLEEREQPEAERAIGA